MHHRSEFEIERAKKWIAENLHGPNAATVKERISRHLASLICGMWPNETWEECCERRGITEYVQWAKAQIKTL